MDEIYHVQASVDQEQKECLARHLRHREPDDNPGSDCIDCNNEIPLKRRLAKPGCRRCRDCQELFETEATWRQ